MTKTAEPASAPSAQRKPLRAIALDGLSGVGKSTVGRRVALELGWGYLDTGASYRAMTLSLLDAGLVPTGADHLEETVAAAAARHVAGHLADLALPLDPGASEVRLAGVDRSVDIRGAAVTATVSAVSAVPEVRALLAEWQRSRARRAPGAVVEGRDIGTVVLPDAPLKLWLTADAGARAARRASETPSAQAGEVRRAVERRDALDSGRAADPARPATDAVVLDTTTLDADTVVSAVLRLAAERGLSPS